MTYRGDALDHRQKTVLRVENGRRIQGEVKN